jgi:hypothetical protein
MRIRQGNDFIFLWAIERSGEPEDFSNAVNIRLHFKNFDCVGEVKSFQIVDGNIVRVEVSPEWASRLGAYRLILSYEFENDSYSDGDQKCVVDVLAFNIVPKTSEADDVTEMAKTTDIMIGLKGDKGDPFTYDDFTPEQIEDLKRPAIEAAESVQIVENQISINEQGRVQAENERKASELTRQSSESERNEAEGLRIDAESLRVTAESSRESAESLRAEAELLRQSSTQEAITNAESATENANTAAQNADDARLAIQDDLALKADQADLVQLADDVSVKIKNLVINGDFNSSEGWTTTGQGTIVDGELVIMTLGTFAWGQSINASIGDMVYFGGVCYTLSGAGISGTPFVYFGDSNSNSRVSNPTEIPTRISGIHTVAGGGTLIQINGYYTGTVDHHFDKIFAINLTETFGEGNEPTKEEMDLLISILGIDYFEGEITIPAQKIMQWQLALIRKNKNAIIALGGTII